MGGFSHKLVINILKKDIYMLNKKFVQNAAENLFTKTANLVIVNVIVVINADMFYYNPNGKNLFV